MMGKTVSTGENWFHAIKYDGYRLRVERNGDRVRLIAKGGNDRSTLFSADRRGCAVKPAEAVRH